MMVVTLKRCYSDVDGICGEAAALCCNSSNPQKSLAIARGNGHLSVMEHSAFTFLVEGVSRALLAQLTRHRIASFSVQSQRYIDMSSKCAYVVPPNIKSLRPSAESEFMYQMGMIHGWYKNWQDELLAAGHTQGEANEDARFVLPNATATSLMVTMNARELMHFFELRCCNRAQWEIRQMAWLMLEQCKIVAPELFKDAGPACFRGPCPEGKMTCGNPPKKE
ncbi:MAG: FAD-dependent thymidylate synthase [Clostridia bacterium]|nr:FAD-dependent thymidylate synthase [Clostridia bacterium]